MEEADWFLNGKAPAVTHDGSQRTKTLTALRSIFRKAVPESIRVEVLAECLSQEPINILRYIVELYLDKSEAVHRCLEVEEKSLI